MGEIIFHVLLLVVLGIFFKESLFIDVSTAQDPIGPAGFPKALIIFTLVLLVISLFQAIRKWMSRDKHAATPRPAELSKVFIGVLAAVAGFLFIVDFLGFTLTSVVFFLFMFYLLGRKINFKEVGMAFLFSLGFTVVFGTILSLQLPRGMDAIKTISYWIY